MCSGVWYDVAEGLGSDQSSHMALFQQSSRSAYIARLDQHVGSVECRRVEHLDMGRIEQV